ncbi:uncharacterized protein LOC129596839 [Paramacrobiotus metropolitanus]|uniref:uncharacterized protein LOC129596839 n=1 Tax=Paramacrobiotus metropolitanus TaxID=2943436 RepID=UPI00244570EF|nr:uncharacterized protein LOC129596839 [Paramacrobiotus metropolitanus]
MKQLAVFALLMVAPVAWCATTANVCRIAGTVVGSVLGSINGTQLEAGCADTSNACSKNSKPNVATNILGGLGNFFGGFGGAGQVVQGALNLACSEVATAGKIADAAKNKDPKEASKQIAKVVCTPINYAAMVSSCNEAVKAAKVPKGSDLTKVKGCENIHFVDTLGKACIPQAA